MRLAARMLLTFVLTLPHAAALGDPPEPPGSQPRLVARLRTPGGEGAGDVAFSGDGTRLLVYGFEDARVLDARTLQRIGGRSTRPFRAWDAPRSATTAVSSSPADAGAKSTSGTFAAASTPAGMCGNTTRRAAGIS